MITAGCYVMHVECDTLHSVHGSLEEYRLAGAREYTGNTKAACIKTAKAAGWLFKRSGKTYCPTCVHDGRAKLV